MPNVANGEQAGATLQKSAELIDTRKEIAKVDDWIVRLRKHLGIVPKSVPQISAKPIPKPPIPDLPLATSSCPHPAGSFEKIEVMRARAERGESLFHPCDNRDILIRPSHCARVG